MKKIIIRKSTVLNNCTIPLPGSKSESNRALIINSLCATPGPIDNLATARDTRIMQELLQSDPSIYNAHDAGTVMRFMTAYLSVKKQNVQITGTARMKQRPIGILVDALRQLGAEITYLEQEGYPPLQISGLSRQKTTTLAIASEISSQYISALLMIAPKLPQGLKLTLTGRPVSTPYITMTLTLMQHFGVKVAADGQTYHIAPQAYRYAPYEVEADWSGASYWYSIFALSALVELRIRGLRAHSLQGDSVLANMMAGFGVATHFAEGMAVLTKVPASPPATIDFINCPDLAQTFAVLCALNGTECLFKGLQTLKIKETDRIAAIKTELQKIGADFTEQADGWRLVPAPAARLATLNKVAINTYDDHRMAMAFAALATRMDVEFDHAEVVNKSYPSFWQDLKQLGFTLA